MYSKSKKNLIVTLIAVLTLAFFIGCGKGKYSDIKEYVDDVIVCMDNHAKQVLKAQTGEEIASELLKYGDDMIALAKRSNALYKKYPELNYDEEFRPKQIKKQMERLAKAINDLNVKVSPHLEQFMDDPAVLEANIKLLEKVSNQEFDEDSEE